LTIQERAKSGKIARAPKVLRDVVNGMLQDNKPQSEIIAFLEHNGIRGVRPQNVSNWRANGFQKWLKQNERLQEMKDRREFALQMVKDNEDSNVSEAAMQLAASTIYEALDDLDTGAIKTLIREQPENFPKLVNSLAKVSDVGLKFKRYKSEVQAAKERIAAELGRAKGKGGIMPETLERIEAELKLL
jgi:hypothetical protein